ncbi:MAG: type II toxin-antitoxin system VapC family toxin [Caldilineaceae bacterium]
MIVVDTNVLAYLFISGERSDICEQVLRKDAEWVAPALWRSEFRNVLSLYLQKGYLNIEKAIRIADAAMAMMEHNEYEVASAQVLTLAAQHRVQPMMQSLLSWQNTSTFRLSLLTSNY